MLGLLSSHPYQQLLMGKDACSHGLRNDGLSFPQTAMLPRASFLILEKKTPQHAVHASYKCIPQTTSHLPLTRLINKTENTTTLWWAAFSVDTQKSEPYIAVKQESSYNTSEG